MSTRRDYLVYFTFAILALLILVPSFDNPFREDDFVFLRHVEDHGFSRELVAPTQNFAFYRPGAAALFSLEHVLFGDRSGLYILANFLMHCGISLLLLRLLVMVGFGGLVAALAAGLYVVGVGSFGKQVMWASAGGGIAATLLVMAALVSLVSSTRGGQLWSTRTIPGWIALAVSPAFHEVGILAPVLIILFGHPSGPAGTPNLDRRRLMLWYALLVFPAAVWASVRIALADSYAGYGTDMATPAGFFFNLIKYPGFMLVPLQPSTALADAPSVLEILAQYSGALHGVIGLGVFIACVRAVVRGNIQVKVLCAWLYLALFPYCLVALPEGWLELRYTYFAAIPLCALIAITVTRRLPKRIAIAIVILFVIQAALVQTVLERKYDSGRDSVIVLPADR